MGERMQPWGGVMRHGSAAGIGVGMSFTHVRILKHVSPLLSSSTLATSTRASPRLAP